MSEEETIGFRITNNKDSKFNKNRSEGFDIGYDVQGNQNIELSESIAITASQMEAAVYAKEIRNALDPFQAMNAQLKDFLDELKDLEDRTNSKQLNRSTLSRLSERIQMILDNGMGNVIGTIIVANAPHIVPLIQSLANLLQSF